MPISFIVSLSPKFENVLHASHPIPQKEVIASVLVRLENHLKEVHPSEPISYWVFREQTATILCDFGVTEKKSAAALLDSDSSSSHPDIVSALSLAWAHAIGKFGQHEKHHFVVFSAGDDMCNGSLLTFLGQTNLKIHALVLDHSNGSQLIKTICESSGGLFEFIDCRKSKV